MGWQPKSIMVCYGIFWSGQLGKDTAFGIEMTEIRDAGIPRDSREKRVGMRDYDPSFRPFYSFFMRVNDTYDRNTCLKESKRLALSTLDDMCL